MAIYGEELYGLAYYGASGALERVRLDGRGTFNLVFADLSATSSWQSTTPVEVSEYQEVTIYVRNQGSFPALARLSTGPDGANWRDEAALEVPPHGMVALVPMIYGRYLKLLYRALEDEPLNLTAWVQGRY